MVFNSLNFFIFLPFVFIAYWLIQPKGRNVCMLLASYYFYFSYNPWFLLLLIGTSVLDFYVARLISKTNSSKYKKTFLVFSLTTNIGVLFIFKYFVFFYNTALSVFSTNSLLLSSFIIPAGLSFYTFQSISYLIDIYRGKYKADDKMVDFLLYVSFFPHMVAGPIVRYSSLMPQLKTTHYFKNIEFWEAFKLMIWGFFKKMVIADNLARIINPVFNNFPSNFNSVEHILVAILFLIQLYADFSGYSDIATGVAKLFNIKLDINWKRPLLSKSITEYWKRHHISLTSWFKEYVYFSLGGNKVNRLKWVFNILFVFILSGLWHGANFTFFIWGVLNGVFYLLERSLNKIVFKIPEILKWIYTMILISLFFIAFRSNNLSDLKYIYYSIFVNFSLKGGMIHFFALNDFLFLMLMFCFLFVLITKEVQEEYSFLKISFVDKVKPIFYIVVLCLIFAFGNFNSNSFIYFQF